MATTGLKLGLNIGYWQSEPRDDSAAVVEAERLGYDSVWTGESYSSDAFSPLVWAAARTERIKLATGVLQLSARTPASAAMQAMTLDGLSSGRVLGIGVGVSGPQVVEGWYGQPFGRPLARTREYVEILRRVLRRDGPVQVEGDHYRMPYDGPGSTGLGKPLQLITHPLRRDIPVFLGAEGPRNVALAAEIADGWVPLYYSPDRPEVYSESLAGARPGFEIAVTVSVRVHDDVAAALAPVKATLAFYIGGMGARSRNFHTDLMARMGYEAEAYRIQELFMEGRRDEALTVVPDGFADEISLVGPRERIRDRLEAWKETPVTTLVVGSRDPDALRLMAELVL